MKLIRDFSLILIALNINSCISYKEKCNYDICDILNQIEKIELIEVPEAYIKRDRTTLKLLSDFPFIFYKPVIDFQGKFPPEFYSSIKIRWKSVPFEKANYWRMRWDPYIYDFIYIKPVWIGNFSLKHKDLLNNLAVSFNISNEEINILKNWVKQGGTLWIESAIFISSYDIELNKISINDIYNFIKKLSACEILGRKLKVFMFKATRIDKFHTKPVVKEIDVIKDSIELKKFLNGVNKLLLTQEDYIGIYYTVEGEPIIKDNKRVYSSYITFGKGKVITTVPFDFLNVHYDGELYRWNLLFWIMNDRIKQVK